MKWRNAAAIEWSGRQLSLFAHADGNVTYYTYSADGIRTKKTVYDTGGSVVSRINYTLDGNKIVAESRNGTNLYYLYDDTGAIMGISYGYDTYTFAKNPQGDVIGIYSGGTLVAKYEYSAYGQILSITNASGTDISNNASHIANINPFRYRGYYYDTETGFYYLQSRYYDPVVGRFLNADAFVSTGQGIIGNNMFAYCLNNPVMYIDSIGYFGEWFSEFGKALKETLNNWGTVYAGIATSTAIDGPLPIADAAAAFAAMTLTAVVVGISAYEASKADSVSISTTDEKDVVKDNSKDLPIVIFRYYSSKTKNLAPRKGVDFDGLSFSTKPPKPGVEAVVTTIEEVNATGILKAIPTGGTHVIIVPVGGTVLQWMEQGQSSIWTQMLSSVVTEVKVF